MTEGLKWTVNHVAKSDDKHLELMSEENVKKANEFHKSFPQYTVTPLQDLAALASYLGVKSIHCKDESYRFGLNAFKVLGGSYAMGRYIAKEGATVTIEEVNYDDCVRMAAAEAAKTEHGVMVQDTAWEGYEEIPSWIMQGYGTMVMEADQQLKEAGIDRPTHVFVQAGVGSLAGAVVGYFAHKYKENPPVMVVCEASAADCLYRSAMKESGELVNVGGDLETIMAGLACGEANTIGWDILRNHVSVFASCPDWMSAKATRIYANPLGSDPHIVSGESGSVPLGLCYTALHDEDAKDLKEALKLDESSNVLVISTEGDTDPVRYREIVWDGLYGIDKSLSK